MLESDFPSAIFIALDREQDLMRKKITKDLTKGNEGKALILFSLPIIAGNLIQQLYNVADTFIVGKYLGPTALAAVGSSYALMVLVTSILLGLCMGSGVLFAQLFGAKKHQELRESIYNSGILIGGCTLVLTAIVYLGLPTFLRWLRIPGEAYIMTKEYLMVIFSGLVFVFIYNFAAAILRSIGNTVAPLIFLCISAVMNIVLDVFCIVNLKMGVGGAALATVVSQGICAVFIMVYFYKKAKELLPRKAECRMKKQLFLRILEYSFMTSIQQSIMNFGILMIQGLVNSFGLATTAAFAAVVKIDGFAYMPAQDFGNAFATFIAQNHGAGQTKRIKEGTKKALLITTIFCGLASLVVVVFAADLMEIFVDSSQVEIIKIGVGYLRIEGACYIGIGILFLLYGLYRGIGKTFMSIVLTVISLGSRVVLAYTLANISNIGVTGIWWAIPIGWVLADLYGIGYARRMNKKRYT